MSKKDKAVVATAAPAIDLNALVQKIGQQTREANQVVEGGIIKATGDGEADKAIYESNLPEGLNLSDARRYQDYDALFSAGRLLGAGELAADAFKANPDLKAVTLDSKLGHHRLDLSIGNDGTVDARFLARGTGSSGSQFGKVRSHISSLVKGALDPDKN